jgi:integrase
MENAKVTKRSWKRDEQLLRDLKVFFGNPKLKDIKPVQIEKYKEARSKQVAPATVNRSLALGKHMYFLAEVWGMNVGNPFRLVKFLREDNLKCETLSEAEEQKLLAAAPPYLKDVILMACNTGLRRSDVFNLKWEDVNFEEKKLTIIMGKSRKVHEVFLNPIALEVVKRQRRDCEYVFTNREGEKIKCVRGALDAAVKRAGLKKTITFHMFRHTVATRLLQNGEDIVSVKEIMGHANISTTLRYAHSNAERQRRAMERLGGSTTLPANDNTPAPEASNDNVASSGDNLVTMPQRKAVG